MTTPGSLKVSKAKIDFTIAPKANADGSIDITVTSDEVAIFVTLTTQAQGRFSDNTFLLPKTQKTIQYIPFLTETASQAMALLKSTLRVEDHSAYAL